MKRLLFWQSDTSVKMIFIKVQPNMALKSDAKKEVLFGFPPRFALRHRLAQR